MLEQADRLQTLNEISRVVSSALDLRGLYDTIYEQVGRVMDATQFFIALQRPGKNRLEIPYLREQGHLSTDLSFPYEDSLTVRVIQSGVPLLFHDAAEFLAHARLNNLPDLIVGEEDSESGIFVPLNTGSRTIGAMTVQSKRPNAYTNDDVQTLSVIAAQAAVAIQNARLYQRSQDAVRQMEALLHVARTINGSLDLGAVLDAVLAGMHEVVPYYVAGILLPDHDKGHLNVAAVRGPNQLESLLQELQGSIHIPFGRGVTGRAFQRIEPIISPDVREDPDFISHGIAVGSEMAVPLMRGDTVIGVLDVERSEVDGFSADDLGLLSLFASQAAIAIENARLFAEQRRRVEELQAIQSIVQHLTPLHDVGGIARVIERELKSLIDYHACRIFLLEGRTLVPVMLADFDPAGIRLHLGEGITGSVALSDRAEIIHNTLLDSRASQILGTPRRAESMVGAPLLHEGKVSGVITLSKLGTHQFDSNDLRLLEIVAAQAAIAVDRARLYGELRRQAVTDDLTGLRNRRYLIERLREEQSRAVRNRHPLAAIILDIDKFKRVNDEYGHDAGDVVLRELAVVIRQVVRAEDLVARYGGEEFCVLLPEVSEEDAMVAAERIRRLVGGRSLPRNAGAPHITVSLGLAMLQPDDDVLQLISRADGALYHAKRHGGNRACRVMGDGYAFVDGEMLGLESIG